MPENLGGPILLVLVVAGIGLVFTFFHFVPIGLWITAAASGVWVKFGTLIGMRFRKVDPKKIVYPMIQATSSPSEA